MDNEKTNSTKVPNGFSTGCALGDTIYVTFYKGFIATVTKEDDMNQSHIIQKADENEFLVDFYNAALPIIQQYRHENNVFDEKYTVDSHNYWLNLNLPNMFSSLDTSITMGNLESCNYMIQMTSGHQNKQDTQIKLRIFHDDFHASMSFKTRILFLPQNKNKSDVKNTFPDIEVISVYEVSSIQQIILLTVMDKMKSGTAKFKFCRNCGKAFIPVRSDQQFCNLSCKAHYHDNNLTERVSRIYRSYCKNLQRQYVGDTNLLNAYSNWQNEVSARTNELQALLRKWDALTPEQQEAYIISQNNLHNINPEVFDQFIDPEEQLRDYRKYLKDTWKEKKHESE